MQIQHLTNKKTYRQKRADKILQLVCDRYNTYQDFIGNSHKHNSLSFKCKYLYTHFKLWLKLKIIKYFRYLT